MAPQTWNDLTTQWLLVAFPALAAHNFEMAKGDRGVLSVGIDIGEMQQMLDGAVVRLEPSWVPAREFIRLIKGTPTGISAESVARWEQQLQVMNPTRDVALMLSSRTADASETFYTRFVVTHDGTVPVN